MPLCGLCPSLGHDGQEEEKPWEEQLDAHQEQLEKEMQEARRMVFRLQVTSSDKTGLFLRPHGQRTQLK